MSICILIAIASILASIFIIMIDFCSEIHFIIMMVVVTKSFCTAARCLFQQRRSTVLHMFLILQPAHLPLEKHEGTTLHDD
jgi:hypothetical protein